MNNLSIRTKNPVPSCTINNLIWDDKTLEWSYEYLVSLPKGITVDEEGSFSKTLFVYGHIHQLKLVDNVTKNSVNITVNKVEEVEEMVSLQYEADMEFRKKWIEENPEYEELANVVEVKNETQFSEYNHIISIKEQKEETTIFIAAPQKRRINK